MMPGPVRALRPVLLGLLLLAAVEVYPPGLAQADVVHLQGGGKVVGKVVSVAGGSIRVETVAGRLSFPADEAVKIDYGPTPQEEYAERKAKVDQRDPAALVDLADWCARAGLAAQERELLEAVIGLDPDQAEARRRLGYTRSGSAWVTIDEAMRAKGLVKRGNRWVTPAERDRLDRQDLERRLQEGWIRAILSSARRLENNNTAVQRQALADLRGIRDPLAIGPLVKVIAQTDSARVRVTLVHFLGEFAQADRRDDRALDALIDIALLDDDIGVRRTAVEVLVEADDPRVPREFVRALDQDSWTLILRASYALGELRAFDAVPDLIRHLTAVEGYREEVSWRWRGGGFSRGGVLTYVPAYRQRVLDGQVIVTEPIIEHLELGTRLGAAPSGAPERVVRRRPVTSQNVEAWRALAKISGRDFGYYGDLWSAWYNEERMDRRRRQSGKESGN